jgi:hypothetical protein
MSNLTIFDKGVVQAKDINWHSRKPLDIFHSCSGPHVTKTSPVGQMTDATITYSESS